MAQTLVTGGAGFIGSWLVRELLARNLEVVVLDDFSNGREENLRGLGRAEVVRGDIADRKLLHSLFRGHRFQQVFHLAARINVQDSIDRPEETFRADVLGTFQLLEEARAVRARFLFTSTCMVYAPATAGRGITEEHPVRPASPYAAAKLCGEALALSYYHAYGLPVAVARPFNTYGPGQKATGEGGVVSIFCQRALRGEKLLIFGDGAQTRDLLYVEDAARFLAEAGLQEKASGEVLNAGSGRDIAVRDLALLIAGDSPKLEFACHPHPQSEIAALRCDYSKAERLLGWRPQISMQEGIRRVKDWLANEEPTAK